jgi:hypothetical protein
MALQSALGVFSSTTQFLDFTATADSSSSSFSVLILSDTLLRIKAS